MNWSPNKPSEHGFYWFRSRKHGEQIVEVHGHKNHLNMSRVGHLLFAPVAQINGEWAGPVRPPGWVSPVYDHGPEEPD